MLWAGVPAALIAGVQLVRGVEFRWVIRPRQLAFSDVDPGHFAHVNIVRISGRGTSGARATTRLDSGPSDIHSHRANANCKGQT